MKRRDPTLLLIVSIVLMVSVQALYATNSEGDRVACRDYTDKEFFDYTIEYGTYDAGGEYYRVVEKAGYPKNLVELGLYPHGYFREGSDDTLYGKYYDAALATFKPKEGVPIDTKHMGWVPFSIKDAAGNIANQNVFLDYYVGDKNCRPCNERGMIEYMTDCMTCAERSRIYIVYDDGNCLACPEGTEPVDGKCVGDTSCPEDQTWSVADNRCIDRCPEHMKWDGKRCMERCASTSIDDYRTWDPLLKKCVDPGNVDEPEPTKGPEPTKRPEPTKAPEPTRKPEPTKDPEEKRGRDKGSITFKKGRVLIERGWEIIPGQVGTILREGDTIVVEEGSEVSVDLTDTGLVKINQKTKWTVPRGDCSAKAEVSPISKLFGGAWVWLKNKLKGESFEIITPTASTGVRG